MFEDQLTGIQVYRKIESGSSGDDYTSNTISETIVLTGLRLVDLKQSGSKANIIDNFGQDVAQQYVVYFNLSDLILNGDYIRFNSLNINKNIAYNSDGDTILRIKNFNTGSGNIGALEAQCVAN